MEKTGNWQRPNTVAFPTIWREFEGRKPFPNGKIPKFRIQDVTEDMLEDVIEFMITYFLSEEPLCKSKDLEKNPLALEDMRQIWRQLFSHKVALVGILENRHELGGETLPTIIGCNMCCLLLKDHPDNEYEPKSKDLRQIFDFVDNLRTKVNVFEHYQTSEILYALGLSVHPKFRGQGIGLELIRARLELGRRVGLKATVTVFTNITSQTIAKQAGFEELAEVVYDEHKIGNEIIFNVPTTKSSKLMGMKLL